MFCPSRILKSEELTNSNHSTTRRCGSPASSSSPVVSGIVVDLLHVRVPSAPHRPGDSRELLSKSLGASASFRRITCRWPDLDDLVDESITVRQSQIVVAIVLAMLVTFWILNSARWLIDRLGPQGNR